MGAVAEVQGGSGRWYPLETPYAMRMLIQQGRHVHVLSLSDEVVCYNGGQAD